MVEDDYGKSELIDLHIPRSAGRVSVGACSATHQLASSLLVTVPCPALGPLAASCFQSVAVYAGRRMTSCSAHHRTEQIDGGSSRADPVGLAVADLAGDVDVFDGVGEVGAGPHAGQGCRVLAHRRFEYLEHENRRRGLRDDLRCGNSRCKDRGPPVDRGSDENQTCMDSSTANCSRRSLRADFIRAGILPGLIMFPRGSLIVCRPVGFSSATVRVPKSGYIMLQYSLVIQKRRAVE